MKKIMSRAWEIAKKAAATHGGKAVEYISAALKMAWAEIKKGAKKAMEVILKTLTGSRNHKTWVAEITGEHATFKYNRVFLEEMDNDGANKFWKLLEGKVYEICDGGHRYFAKVENGVIEEINSYQVSEIFA